MPLLEGFDFLRLGFDVSYRASDEPQTLRIDVTTIDKSTKRSAPIIVKRLIELVNAGAASGALFSPDASFAERLSGPWDGPDAFGPDFSWVLRVKAVSPLFLRTMVDQLRKCGHDQAVTTMRIKGELAPDGSAHSVDAARMRAWLDDPDAYVDEWPNPGFEVVAKESEHTYVAVTMAAPIEPPFEEALKHTAMRWLIAAAAYVDDDGRAIMRTKESLERHLPAFDTNGDCFVASFEEFRHRFMPARAIIVNMLAKMSAQGAAIKRVEIGHPHGKKTAVPAVAWATQKLAAKAASAKKAPVKKGATKKVTTKKAVTKKAAVKKPSPKKPNPKKPNPKHTRPKKKKR